MEEPIKDIFFTVPENYRNLASRILTFNEIPHSSNIGDDIEISHQSKMNYDKIEFSNINNEDIKLARMLKIFEYHHKANHKYSIRECAEATGVSVYFTESTLVKYLDYKKLK